MRCLTIRLAAVVVMLISVTLDGQVMRPGVSCGITGTVRTYAAQPGDSLVSIAARFGVDATALADDNHLRPGTVLRAGDALHLDNRHIVPGELNDGILINIPQRMLFVARANRLAGAYPIAVGQSDWQTPVGIFEIGTKEIDPTWDVPVSIQREMAGAGRPVLTAVPPGPQNPLGDRWLGLKGISVGIHGTNQPTSVFRFTTHGCIRLHPDDARQLFDLVEVGSPVTIVYQPVLVAVDEEGRVWLEVNRDPYGRAGDLSRLASVLLRDAGVLSAVDATGVRRCLQERRGRLCQVADAAENSQEKYVRKERAMQVIKNILVPTDFSPASKSALRYACQVADAFGASVHVMHVFENPFGRETFLESYPPPPREYVEALDRQARADLDAQLTMEEQAKYSAVLTMRMGVPAPEILRYIQEHGAIDLVVMATAGRGGVARLLMGSVADKIVRAAPCPVLTMHPREQADANVTEEAA